MADITITASAVVASATAVVEAGSISGNVTAGQVGCKDSSDGLWKLADNNSATAAAKSPQGIFLNGGSTGQPCRILREGDLTMNAVLTAGAAYYLSDTPGGICPVADLASGETSSLVGIAKSTTVLSVKFNVSGVTL